MLNTCRRTLDPVVRRELVSDLPVALRALRVEVLRETLAAGLPVDPDVVTIVLSAHVDRSFDPMRFESADVESLLWFGISEFCEGHDVEVPSSAAKVLHAVLATAVRLDVLAPGSDGVAELFAPLRELGAA